MLNRQSNRLILYWEHMWSNRAILFLKCLTNAITLGAQFFCTICWLVHRKLHVSKELIRLDHRPFCTMLFNHGAFATSHPHTMSYLAHHQPTHHVLPCPPSIYFLKRKLFASNLNKATQVRFTSPHSNRRQVLHTRPAINFPWPKSTNTI
jgi:hypothetical protein